ncbi:sperm axonemal maintenance protein CFAP97D1 [Antennarius striatus]|uniref:sperm axonemal maintenance protein CFAP97D1 n=1 Tax=Antennarius striatus TaxID=241820 RepID=UPI0035ADCA3E
MHRSYQPLKPVTNRYLQQRWDQNKYSDHRRKVTSALPVVDTRGMRTPAHVQLKLKKLQLQNEWRSTIDRDNHLLASKLANIMTSKGLVDHRNQYNLKSLNADKRREELLLVSRQNQAIYQRITSRQSEYRHQLWLDDWERAECRRDNISRYPQGLADKQRSTRKVKFEINDSSDASTNGTREHVQVVRLF